MAVDKFYEFDRYRVDPRTRRLRRDGEPVSLTPKAFDVLVALIERRDRVVDKAELMKLVWPDSFVEEANLSQTIFVLRKTLGEDANGRPFIDTVPRRGYRFAADIHEVRSEPAVGAERPRRGDLRWAAGAVAIAALLAAVGLWRVRRTPGTAADPIAGKTRVVVLPFENLTRQSTDDWLSGAFSDSITSALRDLDDLVVVNRDRIAELYRERAVSESAATPPPILRQFSQTLGVKYYVHGSYQRVGDDIRVAARLVDAASGAIQAQESVTDRFRELLRLEDELARKLAITLRASQLPPIQPETTSLEAYQLVTEGERLYESARFQETIDKLRRGVALDERYALAWALLSKSYSRAVAPSTYAGGPSADYRRQAQAAARRATELNPSLYEAHVALALADRDGQVPQIAEWRAEAQRAIAINPRVAEAYELLADSYFSPPVYGCSRDRDPPRAEELFRQALRIDPPLAPAYSNLVYHLHFLLRLDEAVRTANQGLETVPGQAGIMRARSTALMFSDRLDEAERDIAAVSHGGKDLSVQDLWVLGSIDAKRGSLDRAAKRFDGVLAKDRSAVWELAIARVYLSANQAPEGAAHLRRAMEADATCARYVSETPAFAPYRTNPLVAAALAQR